MGESVGKMDSIVIQGSYCIALVESEIPRPKENEVLVKLLYGGICGTDLNAYRGVSPYVTYPVIPGHEFSAEIIETGNNCFRLRKGMIVTANPYFNCGHCYSCQRGLINCCETNQTMGAQRDGAFSQYITLPAERVYDSKGIPAHLLALIEPFCISYHGIQRGKVSAGDTVLIMGAGNIGIFAMKAAKLAGAKVYMSDISEEKLDIALQLGADGIILNKESLFLQQVSDITKGNGFDVTIEAVGLADTFQSCIDAAAFGGRVVLIGVSTQRLDFNFTIIQTKELNIFGSRNARKEDFFDLIDLVSQGEVDLSKIISKCFAYSKAGEAFDYFDKNNATTLKTLLEF